MTRMFMVSYSLNYVWAAAIAVWLMWLFLNKAILLRLDGWKMSAIMLLSLLAGWWHEMMLMMLGVPMLLVIVFSDSKFQRRRGWILLAVIVGFIAVMISPAQQSRVESDEMMLSVRNILGWHRVLPQPKAIVQFLYLFTIVMSAGINNQGLRVFRETLSSCRMNKPLPSDVELHLVCVSVCVANLGVLCLFNYGRLSAIGVAFALVGLLAIVSAAFSRLTNWLRLSGKIILVFMMMLFAVNMGLSLELQKRVYAFDNRVIGEWKKSDDGVVYGDVPETPYACFPWHYFINYLYNGEYKLFTISVRILIIKLPNPLSFFRRI